MVKLESYSLFRRLAWATLATCLLGISGLILLGSSCFNCDFKQVMPADGRLDVHPGRNLKVEVASAELLNKTFVLTLVRRDGAQVPLQTRVNFKDNTIVADPIRPLDISAEYTFCVSEPPQAEDRTFLRRFIGHKRCSTFKTMTDNLHRPEATDAPILVVTGADNPYSAFYAEIMRAEGMVEHGSVDVTALDETALTGRSVVVLGISTVSAKQLSALKAWVEEGGTLIAMKPSGALAAALCLEESGESKLGGYVRINPLQPAAKGITAPPLQVHGDVTLYSNTPACGSERPFGGSDVRTVAGFMERLKSQPVPAITLRSVGRGNVVVYAFDLARSVVFTRQGNPVWAGQERDQLSPRRPNDLFYPDYLDRSLLDVPQADEQQRLLANLILTSADMPIPRFWYLPERRRAAIIMVGDDHNDIVDATSRLFKKLVSLSKPGCDLARWQCLRATALVMPNLDFPTDMAEGFNRQGFEIGLHVDSGCQDRDLPVLKKIYGDQMDVFRQRLPFLSKQTTKRLHCLAWNGWTDTAELESSFGVRLDMNYYNWPPRWLDGRPGFMTGSGLPMPFITEDGKVLDVYQAPTQLVNEDGVPRRWGIEQMLDNALGENGYFGAFVSHYDFTDNYADLLVEVAQQRGVALISAQQMLDWLDARNSSRFVNSSWNGRDFEFDIELAPNAEQATVLLPLMSGTNMLTKLECRQKPTPFLKETIKGVQYASFQAVQGACAARYEGVAG